MPAEIKVTGIVLSAAPMGDKDLRVVLLSREGGRLSILAKGALSPKSKWRSVAQPFCCGSYVLSRGKTFWYIKEAELGDSLYELRTDLDRFAWASLMMEVAADFSVEGEENRALVNLLVRGLLAMARENADPQSAASAFLFRLLSDSGYRADLSACPFCGTAYDGEGAWGFLPENGSLVCPACEPSHPAGYLLSRGAAEALRYVQDAPENAVFAALPGEEERTETRRAVLAYLQYHTGERYRSLEFLESL